MLYFGGIVVLFTLSLVHREFILKDQALKLQLREKSRGEVELTSSAVRLLLTGSRGIAVTFLWYNAMDKQKRHEWNELELLIQSITKLQPYFITPWLYQSWNLAFNVAVECDQPKDKYVYIARGLALLAEGERRNRGSSDGSGVVFPGNPDMRHYMGFFYHMKIATSDENQTMRCLLDLSCIDPAERNPDRFWKNRALEEVDLERFARFCQAYPRLVRRMREQLDLDEPKLIVKFLEDTLDIPSRFVSVDRSALGQLKHAELKEPQEQFPILPPQDDRSWPDPKKVEMTAESFDVNVLSRTWYEYAQKPLPPPNQDPGLREPDFDKMRYRLPKNMVTHIFRHYPALAQVNIAESLEAEGFFDRDGWQIEGDAWFERLAKQKDSEFFDEKERFVVGTEAKYHSGAAWAKGHQMYKEYGRDNGLYLDPDERAKLEQRAALCRQELKLNPMEVPTITSQMRQGELGASIEAHERLRYNQLYRGVANFDAFLYQSEAESDGITVCMRKLLFKAERQRKHGASPLMLPDYEQAWPLYVHVCFTHPRFAQVVSMQDELYETYQRYLGQSEVLDTNQKIFKAVAVWGAHAGLGRVSGELPFTYSNFAVTRFTGDPAQMVNKVVPFRRRWGRLDTVRYYDAPAARELREWLFLWTQGARVAQSPIFSTTITCPGHAGYLLTRTVAVHAPEQQDWQRLINRDTHRVVGVRLNLPLDE